MNIYREMLECVRDLKIKKDDLPPISYEDETELMKNPVVLTRQHLIHLLKRYKQERLSQDGLFDWVHFVWFSDLYTCEPDDADCIASVINVLEEIEQEGGVEPDDVDCCLEALENNEIAESLFEDDL